MTMPCPHWWLLDELAGLPRGQGRCKLCGEVKTFPAVFIDKGYNDWGEDKETLPGAQREIVAYLGEKRNAINDQAAR